ncbi:MFS transporter [Lysobacter brunescens]|uniref:MFS transporter n=2 Tax=Lysobacter brunescens TaxID=262323 RepID=A0ABW2YCC5_9GAMM
MTPAGNRKPHLAVLAAVLLCSYAIAMESTVVVAAIPTVIQSFGGLSDMSWVFSAYLIAQAVTMPLFGSASDRLGRKGCFVFAAAIFFAGTLACGLAWDMLSLVLFRVLQGVGAGGLITVGTAALNDVISDQSRGKYQAMGSAVWGIAAISGPVIGSAIMEILDWRYIFWINLPIVVISTILLVGFYRGRPSNEAGEENADRSLAVMPSAYLCVTLLATMIALVHGQSISPMQWLAIGLIGAVSAILLWRSQQDAASALFPTSLLRLPVVLKAVVSAFICGAIAMGLTVYVPTFAAVVLRADYLAISSTVAVMTLTWTFSGIGVGMLIRSQHHGTLVNLAGAIVLAGSLGLCLAALQSGNEGLILVLAMSGVLGIGLGACSVIFSVALQSAVTDTVRGSATSLFYLSRMLGQSIGVAVCGGLLASADPIARELMARVSSMDPADAAHAMAAASGAADSMRSAFLVMFAMLAALAALHLLFNIRTRHRTAAIEPSRTWH